LSIEKKTGKVKPVGVVRRKEQLKWPLLPQKKGKRAKPIENSGSSGRGRRRVEGVFSLSWNGDFRCFPWALGGGFQGDGSRNQRKERGGGRWRREGSK